MSYRLVRVITCDNPECQNRDTVPYAVSGEDDLPKVEGWREFNGETEIHGIKMLSPKHACPSCPHWVP